MLILTRRQGEKIKIGDDIEITITSVEGNSVRIGVDAPKNVEILRTELLERYNQNKTKRL